MEETGAVIIGAGVVGLAIARRISGGTGNVVVFERQQSFGMETSSRNSEVIHGGIYYPKNSLKARLCVEGRDMLYDYCAVNNVPHRKVGKLIVATEPEEIVSLEKLYENAVANGVLGVRLIGPDEIRKIEPQVKALNAIHSAETGIVDSHALMQRLLGESKLNGTSIAFSTEVIGVKKAANGYISLVRDSSGETEIFSKLIVNCAGLSSDVVAGMAGLDVKALGYGLKYWKGQYFRVASKKSSCVNALVYPVPHTKAGGLGVHVTKDLAGGLRLGPDHERLKDRSIDYSVDVSKKNAFLKSAGRFLPFLTEEDLSADTAGIRPKLSDDGNEFRDFIIKEESGNGLPAFVNLIGIESPGLTASLAIAEYVHRMISSIGAWN